MGLYRTLQSHLPCGGCGQPRLTNIQFRTGSDDDLQTYNGGQAVPEAHGMVAGMHYPGLADFYCATCLSQRRQDELVAFYDTLVELMALGRLVMRKGFLVKTPVPAEAVQRHGQTLLERVQKGDTQAGVNLFAILTQYALEWDGQPAKQGTAAYSMLLEHINDAVAQRMAEKGWKRATLIRDDLAVYLDEHRQLQVLTQAE